MITGGKVQKGVFDALDAWETMAKPIDEADFKRAVHRALLFRQALTSDASTRAEEGTFDRVPDLQIDRRKRRGVRWKGKPMHLPMDKINLLEMLAQRAGSLVRHEDLFEFLPTGKNKPNLRVAIQKIKDEFKVADPEFNRIRAVPMKGYIWVVE